MSTVVSQTPQSSSPAFSRKSGAIDVGAESPAVKDSLRLSKHAVLPPITSPNRQLEEAEDSSKNPFTMPPTHEVFTLRERERQQNKQERMKQRKLKVHEKSTYSSRLNAKMASLRKEVFKPDSQAGGRIDKESGVHEDTQFVLATTKDRQIEKEDLVTFVGRKREMFLVQYALGVKREEIRKLETIAKTEEKKLEAAEKYLEESATMFDEFLKENDKNAVEAIKMAEAASKVKLEKVAEIKRLNAHLIATKNEISRNGEMLAELHMYKTFLDRLAPPSSREHSAATAGRSQAEEAHFHFSDPAQLISLFTELEEQNLSLIQNSQETQETLEEMKQSRLAVEKKMDKEIKNLSRQIKLLQCAVEREEEKANDLEIKAKLHFYGEYKAEDQDELLENLDRKVSEVYTKCIGANDANISTLHMLAAIESRLEELFVTIESLPVERVEAAGKAKEKERRIRQREEKLEEQRLAQEERLRRARERVQADPKKRSGRRLVYRSEPPILKKKQQDSDEKKEQEEEELQYFFS